MDLHIFITYQKAKIVPITLHASQAWATFHASKQHADHMLRWLQVARTRPQQEEPHGWDSLGGGEGGGELGGGGERGGGLGGGSAHIHHIPKSAVSYKFACISSMTDIPCQQAACQLQTSTAASYKDLSTTGGTTWLRLTGWGWGRGRVRWRGGKRRRTRWWICTNSSHTTKRRLSL